MTREEIINHFADIAAAVFRAEDVVLPQWKERLKASRTADEKGKIEISNAYLRAIAEEIVNQYPEDQLQILYNS